MRAKKSLGLKSVPRFARAKKALGQNFLKSIPALNKIIEVGEISDKDIILEIGPGKGALTEKLLERAGRVVAVEKDRELVKFLQEKFVEEIGSRKLILIENDILKLNITDEVFSDSPRKSSAEDFLCPSPSLLPRVHSRTLHPPLSYKLIANIPYNITGAILKKFLTDKNQPERMVLMVQHEVAKRITATDKKESILSVSVKAYGTPRLEMKVPARYFSPIPKVDSAIISIKTISREFFVKNKIREERFWEIVHKGFAHKRKRLFGNIKGEVLFEKKDLESLRNTRAEKLKLIDWVKLVQNSR